MTVADARRRASETRALPTRVLVANGHHWDPRWPEPSFPGAESSRASRCTPTTTASPTCCAGKRVLVLGIGNSATDIAVESSRIADETFLAMRRGAYVLPKYLFGMPTDQLTDSPLTRGCRCRCSASCMARMLRLAAGKMTDYGLPKPDHKLLEAHPTVSADLLTRLGHGDITVKPNIDRFDGGRTVRFADGSEEEIDLVVYCTGYKITFPFLDETVLAAPRQPVALYRRVVSPDHPGLYFIGLIQPLGAIMPLAEAQSEWVADLLQGRATLPSAAEMRREIAAYERKMRKRYVASSGTRSRSTSTPTCARSAASDASAQPA